MAPLRKDAARSSFFSWCPHSGLSNQLFELLAALQIARSASLAILLPALLTSKTFGPPCRGACPPCSSGIHKKGTTAPLASIVNVSLLKQYHAILHSPNPAPNRVMRTVDLCHLGRARTQLSLDWSKSKCDPAAVAHLRAGVCSSRDAPIRINCLHTLDMDLRREDPNDGSSSQMRTWFRFSSLYLILHEDALILDPKYHKPPFVPKVGATPHEFEYSRNVMRAAHELASQLSAMSQTKAFACAHLRTGHGAWDSTPTFFVQKRDAVFRGFGKWIGNGTLEHRRGALLW